MYENTHLLVHARLGGHVRRRKDEAKELLRERHDGVRGRVGEQRERESTRGVLWSIYAPCEEESERKVTREVTASCRRGVVEKQERKQE
jgi:hypothetical protein